MVEQIRKICDKRGVSIRALEREIGASNGTIGRWDDHIPSITSVAAVADYFGMSIDELIGRTPAGRVLSPMQEQLVELTDALNDDGITMVLEISRGIAVQSKYKKRSKMGRDKSGNEEFINEA